MESAPVVPAEHRESRTFLGQAPPFRLQFLEVGGRVRMSHVRLGIGWARAIVGP